ncbi:MAG: UDP-N-acetylglucosamine 2-epimerase [Alphaproteobacteria bacterium]
MTPSPSTTVQPKNLLFITGTRADYGKLEPLAKAAIDAGHKVTFFVTGMHMLDQYGRTKIEVHRLSGTNIVEFLNHRPSDNQDIVLTKTITGLSDFLQEHHFDLVLIHGDRIESLAASIVCATNYIRSAHIEGGEVSGTIDELLRHCNTKLSTFHLVSSDSAKRRILRMGEEETRIKVIGSPELDIHTQPTGIDLESVKSRYEISFDDFGLCIFHPVTSEQDTIAAQASTLFRNLEDSGKNFIVIMPNNDPGCVDIMTIIEKLPKPRFRVLPSIRFLYFSELLRNAKVMIGNSSAGVREAPYLGLPSLDIGSRQTNRSKSASVFQCSAFDDDYIRTFLNIEWDKSYERSNEYGIGNATKRFVDVLSDSAIWNLPLQKSFVD